MYRPNGIMSLTEEIKQVYPRHVSQPDPEAEAHEYLLNLFQDALDRGIIPPDTSFERFKNELHDWDFSYRRKQMPVRYAKIDEKTPIYDSNKPVTLQDYLDWGMTVGNLDDQSLESLKFMLDKLQEQNQK